MERSNVLRIGRGGYWWSRDLLLQNSIYLSKVQFQNVDNTILRGQLNNCKFRLNETRQVSMIGMEMILKDIGMKWKRG